MTTSAPRPPWPLQTAADALARAQEAADEAAARLSEALRRATPSCAPSTSTRTRVARLDRELAETTAKRNELMARYNVEGDGDKLTAAVEHAVEQAAEFESHVSEAEAGVRAARGAESDARATHDDARRKADRLQTEVRTLTNLLKAGGGDLWPSLIDQISVENGFETALGAALGDDLDASGDEGAPVHWRGLPPLADTASLPDGAEPLIKFRAGAAGAAAPPQPYRRCFKGAGPGAAAAAEARPAPGFTRGRRVALGRLHRRRRRAERCRQASGREEPPRLARGRDGAGHRRRGGGTGPLRGGARRHRDRNPPRARQAREPPRRRLRRRLRAPRPDPA